MAQQKEALAHHQHAFQHAHSHGERMSPAMATLLARLDAVRPYTVVVTDSPQTAAPTVVDARPAPFAPTIVWQCPEVCHRWRCCGLIEHYRSAALTLPILPRHACARSHWVDQVWVMAAAAVASGPAQSVHCTLWLGV